MFEDPEFWNLSFHIGLGFVCASALLGIVLVTQTQAESKDD
jgi:hypothetical protein